MKIDPNIQKISFPENTSDKIAKQTQFLLDQEQKAKQPFYPTPTGKQPNSKSSKKQFLNNSSEDIPDQFINYQSNPDWFDNRATVHSNSNYSDTVIERVFAGTHEYNPSTGVLRKLESPIDIPQEAQDLSRRDWQETSTGQELIASQNQAAAGRSAQEFFDNPATYLPGSIMLGGVGGAGIRAGGGALARRYLPGSAGSYMRANAQIGGRELAGVNLKNAAIAGGIGFGVNEGANPESVTRESFRDAYNNPTAGNLLEAGVHGGLLGLDVMGLHAMNPRVARSTIQGVKNLSGDLSNFVNRKAASSVDDVGKDLTPVPQSPEFYKNAIDFFQRRRFVKNLQNEGLIGKDFGIKDLNYAARSEEKTSKLTQLALDRKHTSFRSVHGRLPQNNRSGTQYSQTDIDISKPSEGQAISELDNMRKAGVELKQTSYGYQPKNIVSLAEYQATHIPLQDYGYRADGDMSSIYGYLYATNSPQKSHQYGPYQFKSLPRTDYSSGNYKDWYNRYHKNVKTHAENKDRTDFTKVLPQSDLDLATLVGKRGMKAINIDYSFPYPNQDRAAMSKYYNEVREYTDKYQKRYDTGWKGEYKKGGYAVPKYQQGGYLKPKKYQQGNTVAELNFDSVERAIRHLESNNGQQQFMRNNSSTATGLYGQRFSEIGDIYSGTRDDFQNDLEAQRRIFNKRFNEGIGGPSMSQTSQDLMNTYSNQIPDFDYSQNDLALLSNLLGRAGAMRYLGYHRRDGKPLEEVFPHLYGEDVNQPNKTPQEYLKEGRMYYKKGGRILPRKYPDGGGNLFPTTQDSMFLYNHSVELDKWMAENDYEWDSHGLAPFNKEHSDSRLKRHGSFRNFGKHIYDGELEKNIEYNDKLRSKSLPFEHYIDEKGNLTGLRDWNWFGGDDKDLPFTYRHPNIDPSFEGDMVPKNNRNSPLSYSYRYDPVQIWPQSQGNVPAEGLEISKKMQEKLSEVASPYIPNYDTELSEVASPYIPNYDTDLSAWLQREGKSASYADRKKLYEERTGLSDYKGTSNQNIDLLNILKEQGTDFSDQQVSYEEPVREKTNVFQHSRKVNGQWVPITEQNYETKLHQNEIIERIPGGTIDSTRHDVVPFLDKYKKGGFMKHKKYIGGQVPKYPFGGGLSRNQRNWIQDNLGKFGDNKFYEGNDIEDDSFIEDDPSIEKNPGFLNKFGNALGPLKDMMGGMFPMAMGIGKSFMDMERNNASRERDFIQNTLNSNVMPTKGYMAPIAKKGGHFSKKNLYKSGGLIETLGYKDYSPWKNRPFIDIQSDTITMNDVGMPLLLVPDVGNSMVGMPNQGEINFPGASKIREIPLAQMGMEVEGEESMMEDNTPQPIQTEKGEMIATPEADIFPVNATKTHKQMDDYEITDILSPGSYVFSNHKSMKLNKTDADDMVLSIAPMKYGESGKSSYKENTLGDFFRKKQELPAQVAKRILNKYKTLGETMDADGFSITTDMENKMSRIEPLQALIHMSEEKKGPEPISEEMEAMNMKAGGVVQKYQSRGYVQPPRDNRTTPQSSWTWPFGRNNTDPIQEPENKQRNPPPGWMEGLGGLWVPSDESYPHRFYNWPEGKNPEKGIGDIPEYSTPPVQDQRYKHRPDFDNQYYSEEPDKNTEVNAPTLGSESDTPPDDTPVPPITPPENNSVPPRTLPSNRIPPEFQGTSRGRDSALLPPPDISNLTPPPEKPNTGRDAAGNIIDLDAYFKNKLGSLDKDLEESLARTKKMFGRSRGNLFAGTMLGALGTMAQDPYVESPNISSRFVDQMQRRVPEQIPAYYRQSMNEGIRPMTRQIFENTPQMGRASSMISTMPGNIARGHSELASNIASQNMQAENSYLSARHEIAANNELGRVDARNRTSANINQNLAGLAGLGTNHMNQLNMLNMGQNTHEDFQRANRNRNEIEYMRTLRQLEELRQMDSWMNK